MTNGMVNLSELGMRQLLEHRASILDQSQAIQADASGWRLLKADEQKRVEELLNEAQRCTEEFERRRREFREGVTDQAAWADAMRHQSDMLYSRSSI